MAVPVRRFQGCDPNYEYLEYLGAGAFARVSKVRRKADGKILACKSIDLSDGSPVLLEAISRELRILRSLSGCRGCVEWDEDVALDTQNQRLHLHMKYYVGGSLKDFIGKRVSAGAKLTEVEVMVIFEDLVNGLKDFHGFGVLHRDIKPENILMHRKDTREDVSGTTSAYFADFGLGKFSTGAHNPAGSIGSGVCGTPIYMAPETIGTQPIYSQKSDIFSLGCTMFELCELRRPFHTLEKISVPEMSTSSSQTLKTLIHDCMALNHSQRLDTATLYARFTALGSGWKAKAAQQVLADQEDSSDASSDAPRPPSFVRLVNYFSRSPVDFALNVGSAVVNRTNVLDELARGVARDNAIQEWERRQWERRQGIWKFVTWFM